jgi:hypothetical protein
VSRSCILGLRLSLVIVVLRGVLVSRSCILGLRCAW